MDAELPPELEALIRRKIEAGECSDRAAVMREALGLLAEKERLQEAHLAGLREALAEGLAQAERGDLLDGPAVLADLRATLDRARDGAA